MVELAISQHAKMFEEHLKARDPLPGLPDVAPLPAVGAARTGEAIIGSEYDGSAAEDVHALACFVLQRGPTDGAVANVKGEFEVPGRRLFGFHIFAISQILCLADQFCFDTN